MTEEFGMISTFGGRTPSPTIDEDQVFVAEVSFGWGDHAGAQDRIFAFNKNTGELNWSAGTGGIPVDAPQNTPVVAVVNGQRLVIFASGDGSIDAFQARTGKPVWRYRASKRGINTSVVVDGTHLYCSHGLENFDTSTLGRVFCLDLTKIENGAPKEIWKITGDEAAFPTSCVTDKWVYVVDDKARLYQIDKMTGKVAWKKAVGRIGKPSPVWGDGKIYAADGNGQFTIIQPGDTQAEVLSKVDLPEKLGREYAMYGSPAIADGRVYVQTATKIYCIGSKEPKPASNVEIPPMPEEKPAENKAAQLLVLPGDVALHAGQEARFHVKAYDANGRELKDVPADQVKWAIGELTLPPPPRPPAMPKPETSAAGAAGGERTGAPAPGAEARHSGTRWRRRTRGSRRRGREGRIIGRRPQPARRRRGDPAGRRGRECRADQSRQPRRPDRCQRRLPLQGRPAPGWRDRRDLRGCHQPRPRPRLPALAVEDRLRKLAGG